MGRGWSFGLNHKQDFSVENWWQSCETNWKSCKSLWQAILGVAVGILRKDQKRFRSLQSIFFKHWILYIAYRFLIPLLEILKKILSERLRFGARLKPPHSLLSPHYSQYWFPIIHSTGGELPWKISHSQTSNVFLHKMDNSQTISSWKSDYAR